jgi:amino acid transporter
MLSLMRRLLIGRPLHNMELLHEKLPKWKALSIFSSDAISSVGYGPEQIALVLAVPGLLAYGYFNVVVLAVLVLLAVVTISYVQVARANPGGGGSYSVAIHNLGELPALVAAASLFADYVLTVAVSISSGTDALVSAFPHLVGNEVAIDLVVLFAALMIINLRGVRESANVFVLPTYLFMIGMLVMIVTGIYQALTGTAPLMHSESMARAQFDSAMLILLLRAFANGCSSMTGVEAISNGVPMFQEPQVSNAVKTTYWMSGLLGFILAGISFLIMHYHLLPQENITILSQLAENVFGRDWFYYYIQITTMLILYLAANTSYNGLPPLMSILARDKYLPRYLGYRGERLSYSNGIILLSLVAGALIWFFNGNVEHLISLYAIGVFLSFTIAQTALVVYWRKERSPHWRTRAFVNGMGAVITGLVVLVIAEAKFFYGAWIILVFIPFMVLIFKKIHKHYDDMAEQLHLPQGGPNPFAAPEHGRNFVVVTIASPTSLVAQTIRYAKTISKDIIALYVATDQEESDKMRAKWGECVTGVPLVTVPSNYRLVLQPILDFVEKLEREKKPEDYITVLIPEFETRKWWHRFLHNQTGWVLRTRLILRDNVIVTTIPYHLKK